MLAALPSQESPLAALARSIINPPTPPKLSDLRGKKEPTRSEIIAEYLKATGQWPR